MVSDCVLSMHQNAGLEELRDAAEFHKRAMAEAAAALDAAQAAAAEAERRCNSQIAKLGPLRENHEHSMVSHRCPGALICWKGMLSLACQPDSRVAASAVRQSMDVHGS